MMTPRARFWVNEKRYWQEMPLVPFCWMLGVILVSGYVSLLLPVAAYALQRWASTWNWQDRWTSLRVLATPGIVFVCCLLALALLDRAQFWIIPPFIGAMQHFWQAHLPGNLSLSPLDFHALVARLVLFLPLAPGLALLYEYIAPRTRTQPHRMLLPADLVVPLAPPPAQPVAEPDAPPATQHAPVSTSAQKPLAAHKKKQPLHRKGQQPASMMEQMTIDRFLAETASPFQKTETKAAAQPSPAATTPKASARKPPDEPIDWDNVLE